VKLLRHPAVVLFGWIPVGVAIVMHVMIVSAWIKEPKAGTDVGSFHVFGVLSTEAKYVLLMIGYLLLVIFCRYIAILLGPGERDIAYEVPKITTSIQYVFGKGLFLFSVIPAAFWPIAIQPGEDVNIFLLPLLVILSGASWFAANAGFMYPFQLDSSAHPRPWELEEGTNPYPLPPIPKSVHRVSSGYTPPNVPSKQVDPVARERKAKFTFNNIFGNTEIKKRLWEAGHAVILPRKPGEEPRNGILLDGEPGNGKSALAEALAGELDLPFFTLTHSDVASEWVSERTVKVKNAFDQAKQNQPCVFFIDEFDSFISSRDSKFFNVKEDHDVVNSLLTLLVDIRQHKVVVMAATNYAERLDAAAIREGRFDFKVEVTPPDEEARIGLLKHGLSTHVPQVRINTETVISVAQRWNGFSVKRILAVTEELPTYIANQKAAGKLVKELDFSDLRAALRRVQGHKGVRLENVKPMSELVLPDVTREAMNMLVGRLRDPLRVERLGGTLPTGVLFYGPPGTGKTVACKALAKEVDCALLIATGPDLSRDPKELDKLFKDAKEIRPTIIFIDEADDLLRSREYSNYTEATNKLLTLMDGVNDRVKDVLWVAATNHYDQIDPALLRGGRFTEKVEFELPNSNQLEIHLRKWIEVRKIKLVDGLTPLGITEMIGDESIANAEAVMQVALNRAISISVSDEVTITLLDIERALMTVLGDDS